MRKCLFAVLFSLLIAFVSALSPGEAAILYVPKVYETIQSAIDDGNAGDTVLVAPGRYSYINFNGFAGTVASYYLTTGDQAYIDSTVIDADGHPVSVVRFNSRETAESRLCGFTLTGGRGSLDIERDNAGGGIHCLVASPIIDHLRIIDNIATFGGGIFLQNSHPLIRNVRIEDNLAIYSGGGIHISRFSSPDVIQCIIINNHSQRYGGAISCYYRTDPRLINVTISNNVSDSGDSTAAVVTQWGNHVSLTNCIIRSNRPRSLHLGSGIGTNDTIIVMYSNVEGGSDSVLNGVDDFLYWQDGNLVTDPIFRDIEAGDYRLSSDSPCIDAGDPDSPEDPDGTRADMGAYAYHQQDIEVYPPELFFWALPFGEVDSQLVLVVNIGDSPLTFRVEQSLANSSVTMREADGRQIVVPAGSGHALYAFYHSIDGAEMEQSFTILSDDPDEAEITVTARIVLEVSDLVLHPEEQSLLSAYPNPFNSTTTIRYFQSPHAIAGGVGGVSLRIYDLSGRQVADLSGSTGVSAGQHKAIWDAGILSEGVYLLKLQSGDEIQVKKLMLLK